MRCEDSPNTHSKNKDATNKLLEPMLRMSSKDARPMTVSTTLATTHTNNKQDGTRKRINKKTNIMMSKRKTKERYGFAKLMFSGDGQRKVNSTDSLTLLNITPGM